MPMQSCLIHRQLQTPSWLYSEEAWCWVPHKSILNSCVDTMRWRQRALKKNDEAAKQLTQGPPADWRAFLSGAGSSGGRWRLCSHRCAVLGLGEQKERHGRGQPMCTSKLSRLCQWGQGRTGQSPDRRWREVGLGETPGCARPCGSESDVLLGSPAAVSPAGTKSSHG